MQERMLKGIFSKKLTRLNRPLFRVNNVVAVIHRITNSIQSRMDLGVPRRIALTARARMHEQYYRNDELWRT